MTFRYLADFHGEPAIAVITLEELNSHMVMTGEIRSAQASFSFRADIYGDGGYGEMVDEYRRDKFLIQVQNLSSISFILKSSPFLSPTNYYFLRLND
jgi:hypothetical protein